MERAPSAGVSTGLVRQEEESIPRLGSDSVYIELRTCGQTMGAKFDVGVST